LAGIAVIPSIAPTGEDHNVCPVVDDLGRNGRIYLGTRAETARYENRGRRPTGLGTIETLSASSHSIRSNAGRRFGGRRARTLVRSAKTHGLTAGGIGGGSVLRRDEIQSAVNSTPRSASAAISWSSRAFSLCSTRAKRRYRTARGCSCQPQCALTAQPIVTLDKFPNARRHIAHLQITATAVPFVGGRKNGTVDHRGAGGAPLPTSQLGGGRPWTSDDDVVLRDLASAGKYVVTIAVEMSRSESVIRSRAKGNGLEIAKKAKGKPKRTAAEPVEDEAAGKALNPIGSRQTISDDQAEPEFQENHKRLKAGRLAREAKLKAKGR
jgi:hypothetical protein